MKVSSRKTWLYSLKHTLTHKHKHTLTHTLAKGISNVTEEIDFKRNNTVVTYRLSTFVAQKPRNKDTV